MGWTEEIYHAAALLDYSKPLSRVERELLRAAHYRIEVALGLQPVPASERDIAANAFAARTMELEHEGQ